VEACCQDPECSPRGQSTQLPEEQPLLVPNDKSQYEGRYLRLQEAIVPEAETEAKSSLCSPDLNTTAEEGGDTK